MKPEQALKIIDGIEEVRGSLPEDGLQVEQAERMKHEKT